MGLYVHSLSRLPLEVERDYYLYVLDFGWAEPLGQALHENFKRMADLAAKNDAVVIAGTDSRRFAEEVLSLHVDDPQFSWRNVNGESGDDLLPALMISTIHPHRFRDQHPNFRFESRAHGFANEFLILVPLRDTCQDATDVISLIERVFEDVAAGKLLTDFSIAKRIKAGEGGALSDAVILKPSLWGVGVDLKQLTRGWKGLKRR